MPFPHGHALLIGVGTYQHATHMSVPVTAADAQGIAEILTAEHSCGYPADQVTVLRETTATRQEIINALDTLIARVGKDDTVILFYSGHGEYDTGSSYTLTTHDTRWQGPRVVPGTGISQQELVDKLRQLQSERVLLLFNACHAGEVNPTLGDAEHLGTPLPPQAANALLSAGSGRIIITACRDKQVSYVGAGTRTIFAEALRAGLQGESDLITGRNGYVSAFDLYTHLFFTVKDAVEQTITANTRQTYGEQEPELTILKGVGPFAVSLYRGATTLGAFDTDHTPAEGTAVRQVEPARSRAAYNQVIQHISGAGAVGVGGDSTGTIITGSGNRAAGRDIVESGRDTIQASGNVDYTGGDRVGGDKISGDISVNGGVRGTGNVIGHKVRTQVQQGSAGVDLAQLFAPIYQQIAAKQSPAAIKTVLADHVHKIEDAAQEGEQADATQIEGWLAVIASMAPDILEVVASTLTSPVAGVAMTVKKIAAKAKQEREQG
jgi:hypothetical protein